MASAHHDSQNIVIFLKGSLIHNVLCKGLTKAEEEEEENGGE